MSPIDSPLLDGLNPEQSAAVTHFGSPLLIVAGAGSGKTRVITHRIAYLVLEMGIPIWQILAVTFTNKAAREMRERICRLLGVVDEPSLAISTFHSRCAMMLRRDAEAAKLERSFAILDDRDQQTAVKKAMANLGVTDKKVRPSQVQNFINLAKMKLLTPEDCQTEFDQDEIPYADLYAEYQKILDKNNSLDFEDLIFRTVKLLESNEAVRKRWNEKYRHILVDEYQDTNHSQFRLVELLTGQDKQICVVGDEDQSIYSWRGADVNNLLDFADSFPGAEVIRLERNYRSVGNVLKAASGVIKNNKMRLGKELWTEEADGDQIRAIVGSDDAHEAEDVASVIQKRVMVDGTNPEEIAIFYRSHRLSRAMEDALRKVRLPYRILGGTRFYDRAEIKDVLSFMRLAVQPTNDLAYERVINVPTRGVGAKTHNEIITTAGLKGVSQFEATREMLAGGLIKGKAKKGLEEFTAAVERWNTMAQGDSVREVLEAILEDTRYTDEHFGDKNSLDAQARLDNIEELQEVVKTFELEESDHSLTAFLEGMALDAQRDEGEPGGKVSMMTVHNAKGLEFDEVFIIGLEDGVFPNSRVKDDPAQFEEERRLFYVALTRARKRLTLSRAQRRMSRGFYENTQPSQFLHELPEDLLSQDDRRKLGLMRNHYAGRPSPGYSNRAFGNSSGGFRRSTPVIRNRDGAFSVGDKVEHAVMGIGEITEAGGRFGAERVYVEFEDGRSQEFMVKFAPLKKVQ